MVVGGVGTSDTHDAAASVGMYCGYTLRRDHLRVMEYIQQTESQMVEKYKNCADLSTLPTHERIQVKMARESRMLLDYMTMFNDLMRRYKQVISGGDDLSTIRDDYGDNGDDDGDDDDGDDDENNNDGKRRVSILSFVGVKRERVNDDDDDDDGGSITKGGAKAVGGGGGGGVVVVDEARLISEHLNIVRRVVPEFVPVLVSQYANHARHRKHRRSERLVEPDKTPICPTCHTRKHMDFDEGRAEWVCMQDGHVMREHVDEAWCEYGENHGRESKSSYKRINHASETLSQIQGHEGTIIDPAVERAMMEEVEKHRAFLTLDQINWDMIGMWLKKHKYNHWSEHIPLIHYRITGRRRVQFVDNQETTLKDMFKAVQKPYDERPPHIRKKCNFPSYAFIFHKSAELKAYEHEQAAQTVGGQERERELEKARQWQYLSQFFRLLKSPDKIREHQQVWEYFCDCLGWPKITTVYT